MGPFISDTTKAAYLSGSKTGLINRLLYSLDSSSNIHIETTTLPTFRVIEKVANQEVKNWITFSTDGSVTLTGLQAGSPVAAFSKNAITIPIAGFEIKLWANKPHSEHDTSPNRLISKTVLVTRNFHYTGFEKLQTELKLNKKSAPSLFSAVKMLVSDRSDFLLASVPAILWNLNSLQLSEKDIYPVELPEHLKLFTNIFIILDHELPKTFLQQFTNHIQRLEKSGKLQKMRIDLNLEAPRTNIPYIPLNN